MTAKARAFGQDYRGIPRRPSVGNTPSGDDHVMIGGLRPRVRRHGRERRALAVADGHAVDRLGREPRHRIVVLDDEYWRLFTSVFLHGGLIHLAMNMWSLLVIGPLVERLYGNLAFAVSFIWPRASEVRSPVSTASPLRVGVGASGAICGVLGGARRLPDRSSPSDTQVDTQVFRGSLFSVVVFMAILGIFRAQHRSAGPPGRFVHRFSERALAVAAVAGRLAADGSCARGWSRPS